MTTSPLTRERAVQLLFAYEPEIRALGVERLALFGSVLRGDARPDSDIDLLVQFSPGANRATYEWDGLNADETALIDIRPYLQSDVVSDPLVDEIKKIWNVLEKRNA